MAGRVSGACGCFAFCKGDDFCMLFVIVQGVFGRRKGKVTGFEGNSNRLRCVHGIKNSYCPSRLRLSNKLKRAWLLGFS